MLKKGQSTLAWLEPTTCTSSLTCRPTDLLTNPMNLALFGDLLFQPISLFKGGQSVAIQLLTAMSPGITPKFWIQPLKQHPVDNLMGCDNYLNCKNIGSNPAEEIFFSVQPKILL